MPMRRLRNVSDPPARPSPAASAPRLRMVPDVPTTRSKPRLRIFSAIGVSTSVTWLTRRRSSLRMIGSLCTNLSVRRMTPSLRL